jgi:hypothetical protein
MVIVVVANEVHLSTIVYGLTTVAMQGMPSDRDILRHKNTITVSIAKVMQELTTAFVSVSQLQSRSGVSSCNSSAAALQFNESVQLGELEFMISCDYY